jgi:hypothetical protein
VEAMFDIPSDVWLNIIKTGVNGFLKEMLGMVCVELMRLNCCSVTFYLASRSNYLNFYIINISFCRKDDPSKTESAFGEGDPEVK